MDDTGGKVGPFFYLRGRIVSDSVTCEKAESYGEFKTWGSHSSFWDRIPKGLRTPPYAEYTQCLRGRVTFHQAENRYLIYLHPKLDREKILEQIMREFHLAGCDYTVDSTDEHYRTLFP